MAWAFVKAGALFTCKGKASSINILGKKVLHSAAFYKEQSMKTKHVSFYQTCTAIYTTSFGRTIWLKSIAQISLPILAPIPSIDGNVTGSDILTN
jgi:hypothetical protein